MAGWWVALLVGRKKNGWLDGLCWLGKNGTARWWVTLLVGREKDDWMVGGAPGCEGEGRLDGYTAGWERVGWLDGCTAGWEKEERLGTKRNQWVEPLGPASHWMVGYVVDKSIKSNIKISKAF